AYGTAKAVPFPRPCNIPRPCNLRRHYNLCQLAFVRVANDLGHTQHCRDFIRSALSVAASDYNLTLGILTMDASDGSARVLIGGGGHGASVEHHNLCLRRGTCATEATLTKLALDGGAVGLSGPAAKVLYIETGHGSIVT